MATYAELTKKGLEHELVWARVDTRFHVYPGEQPQQLALHNWHGWWLPQPDGSWYQSPVSFVVAEHATAPALNGKWVKKVITKYHDRELTLSEFLRETVAQ